MSHEVNTPLTIIMGHSHQMKRSLKLGTFDPVRVAEQCEKIEQMGVRISDITRGLRTFVRDATSDVPKLLPLHLLVEDILEFCRQRFHNHQIEMQTPRIKPSLVVECRPIQIGQVMLNLLNNAFEAVQSQSQKWVRIEVTDSGDYVEIAISDSGPGLPAEIREHLAEPYYTSKPAGKGTGVGLTASKRIIEAHRGTLQLDRNSTATRFVIRLPKAELQVKAA